MSDLPKTTFGRTGFEVTRLGYGAMELMAGLRGRAIEAQPAKRLLNAVLDAGINFIDTSPDYGNSEILIGEAISHRRDQYFLASKCGCPINQPRPASGERPPHVFTRQNIRACVEQSLKRMKTDHLDLVQFHHNPTRSVLEENDSVAELDVLKAEGKIRFTGMSGDLPNLKEQIEMGVFDAFQIPYSLAQPQHHEWITKASRGGAGTVIRSDVARSARATTATSHHGLFGRVRDALQGRKDVWHRANFDDLRENMSMMEFMLRFTISHSHVNTTIVGTLNPDHLADNVRAASRGPLSDDVYEEAKRRVSRLFDSPEST